MTLTSELTKARPAWRRLARRIARTALSWRFRNFNPSRQGSRTVRIAGLELEVGRGVFDPALHFTSEFMAEYLLSAPSIASARRVLDVGTGTGVLAIAAARAGAGYTLATDTSPAATACASANVRRHDLTSRVAVHEAAFVPPNMQGLFDLVICNPPYFRGTPRDYAQAAYMGGENLEWFERFTSAVSQVLTPGARVLMVLSDAADLHGIGQSLTNLEWTFRVAARRDILIEVMYILELKRA